LACVVGRDLELEIGVLEPRHSTQIAKADFFAIRDSHTTSVYGSSLGVAHCAMKDTPAIIPRARRSGVAT
jgi:hypothetical protein